MGYIFSLLILATQAFVTILPNPVAVPAPFPGGKNFQDDILLFDIIISGLSLSIPPRLSSVFCFTFLFISD